MRWIALLLVMELGSTLGFAEEPQPKPIGADSVSRDLELLRQKEAELAALQAEVDRLRAQLGQISIQVELLEVSTGELRERGIELPRFSPMGAEKLTADVRQQLDELRRQQLLKVLADQTVLTRSGQRIEIRSGGEFPVPVPHVDAASAVEWRPFGIELKALPTLTASHIQTELSISVSERDFANAVKVDGQIIPSLTTRRIHAVFTSQSGEAVMVGGLVSKRLPGRKAPAAERAAQNAPLVENQQTADGITTLVLITVEHLKSSVPDAPPIPRPATSPRPQ